MVRTAIPGILAALCVALSLSPATASDDLRVIDVDGTVLATFSQAQAEALGTREIVTTTFWTKGRTHFTGVDAERLLDAAGLSDVDITVVALDDYAATLTWDDLVETKALFATRMNGERLTIDNRGPFWIVFDFDAVPARNLGEFNSKSVWHVVEVEIEPVR